MAEQFKNHEQYQVAHDLMDVMVRTSQIPGGGNHDFVYSVGDYLGNHFAQEIVSDPEYPDRSLLVVEVGDPEGEQSLVTISHSDVVGVDSQVWQTDPFTLTEHDDLWIGRGVCDTHGSGVSMLMAAMRPGVQEVLSNANKKVSIIFTYDEEATTPELSMRGARLAAGSLGKDPVAVAPYFIAGEPTETKENVMVPMRAHKGRFLGRFTVEVANSGHVADIVQNALTAGSSIIHEIGEYAKTLTYGSEFDEAAAIYLPSYSTAQVSAGEVKASDYSTTPSKASFVFDMRTLHDAPHEWRVRELTSLIKRHTRPDDGVTVALEVLKDAPGSATQSDSPIVKAVEAISGQQARGFNGGDEGRIFRLSAGKQGITIGPGELRFAHKPDEEVRIASIFKAADLYEQLFIDSVNLEPPKE